MDKDIDWESMLLRNLLNDLELLYWVFFMHYFKTKLTFSSIFIRILDFFSNFHPPCNFNLIFFFFEYLQKNTNIFFLNQWLN